MTAWPLGGTVPLVGDIVNAPTVSWRTAAAAAASLYKRASQYTTRPVSRIFISFA